MFCADNSRPSCELLRRHLILCTLLALFHADGVFANVNLVFSASPTRMPSSALANASVSGNIYVFTTPDTGVGQVLFWLDDPNPANPGGAPIRTENLPPFDFAGAAVDGTALPLNVGGLAIGPHAITARALINGTVRTPVSASFTVSAPSAGNVSLAISTSPLRTQSTGLAGASVSGNIYVFTTPDTGVNQVLFWLDNPNPANPTGIATRTEGAPRFDFAGTNNDSTAVPFNASSLAPGIHKMTARAMIGGIIQSPVTAQFTVNGTPRARWGSIIPFPIVPVTAANLRTGQVLLWSGYFPYSRTVESNPGETYSVLFNPQNDTVGAASLAQTTSGVLGHEMFCPGTSNLPDGRILVSGGSNSAKTSIYDPATNRWVADAMMNIPRGYQADAVLSNGQVFTLGGSWSGGVGGKNGEIWTSGGTGWRVLSGVLGDPLAGPDSEAMFADNHMWLFTVGNGTLFHAGPSAEMHWISTNGNGGVSSAGLRSDDAYSINGNAVLFDVGRILKLGGAPGYESTVAHPVTATNRAYLIDIRGTNGLPKESGTVAVTKLNAMTYARAFPNSVALPNGQVVVIGGVRTPFFYSDFEAALVPELWDPVTLGFSPLAPMQVPRPYHSLAILLPDGRVLAAGGGLCGTNCAGNHPNAEILTPPYLLNADGTLATRPRITSAPTEAVLGSQITVATDSPVAAASLMRMSSVTHSLNNDQRRIPLPVTPLGGNTYRVSVPQSAGVAPPGYYMLFALNGNGVPSISTGIRIHP